MRTFATAALIGTLAAPIALTQAAFAQTTDIAAITCGELAAMPLESISMVLTWIDGYMGGAAQDTSLDVERLGANIDAATQACAADPAAKLMDVLYAAENG